MLLTYVGRVLPRHRPIQARPQALDEALRASWLPGGTPFDDPGIHRRLVQADRGM
ncbi:hypothetical protein [Eleftheria terrae]|uniref:hypothetical protein n=1 Tax=Eleftheria terrae TaxID=1597781 RepID=UPI00263A426E|nr:hypothetical protein [Eleftheria terrae]WKB52930.1 hypothetical protein N7L95_00570 [Eleftheria terrae]